MRNLKSDNLVSHTRILLAVSLFVASCAVPALPAEVKVERPELDPALLDGQSADHEKGGLPIPRLLKPTVEVVHVVLTDNGDGDGRADTNETIQMRLKLYNRMGKDLTGLSATLSTTDPKIACLTEDEVSVGEIGDRETRLTESSFEFQVADVDRQSVAEVFSVTFEIAMSADQFAALSAPETVTIDLDLDVTGGSEPTTYFEGFEGGFGSFTTMHLDLDLNPPENDLGNQEAGLTNSDGYRCRYDDPDFDVARDFCHLGAHAQPDTFYFNTTVDRAFSGSRSLHFGIFLNQALGFTTPNATLQAVRSTAPVNLGWGRVCSATRTQGCGDSVDCPIGEECVDVSPELALVHQISQLDHREISSSFGGSQRAIVQVQLVDEAGQGIGPWIKVEPHFNPYDTQDHWTYINCSFDPIDDGNTEDDFWPDNSTFFGPSSTCFPERTFVHQGNTEVFDPDSIGDASDGPGLAGASGAGTWVEARFDLRRFRGRRVHLRLLESTLELTSTPHVEFGFRFNPSPVDDGWFVDDIRVSDASLVAGTVAVDTRENLDIKEDFDFDGVGGTCDCNSDDETAWDLPGRAANLRLDHSGGTNGSTTIRWDPPEFLGGTGVFYDTVRSGNPADFDGGGSCVEADDGDDTMAVDPLTPASGALLAYLVRAENSCGAGPTGAGPAGFPRPVPACP